MVNRFDALCSATQTWPESAISRAQLPLLLAKVDGEVFAQVLYAWFGLILSEEAKRWFTFDGKELRGSIQSGHQRGEACVSAQAHDSGQIVGQTYFNGTKESERPAVLRLLNDSGLCSQKITLDALHLTPKATKAIDGSKGVYLIGLKSNQAHLYRYCLCKCLTSKAAYERIDEPQRGHGRIDQRSYACHSLPANALAARWRKVGMGTCVAVTRTRNSLEGKPISQQTQYYVSNARPADQKEAEELFDAIRRHWLLEVTHHYRDVTLAEDDLKTKSQPVSKIMSSLRTLTVNLLKRMKPKNMAAQIDKFADNFNALIQFMTQQVVL
ncbi:putative transposase YbfD/YdcC [Rhabdobacter roseus]|uniref:Putative transposase YbfD/YdcC n=1 Tax=Rhabdobacter roseus TaxID=1655419 RepID=A0A840TJ81_9BACT|nr:ISAs1 family transposase [Rhabdobacter roseus]MBB5284256.1 putative transposase YbfD/YdcC [Rhabdobacter roseus]